MTIEYVDYIPKRKHVGGGAYHRWSSIFDDFAESDATILKLGDIVSSYAGAHSARQAIYGAMKQHGYKGKFSIYLRGSDIYLKKI